MNVIDRYIDEMVDNLLFMDPSLSKKEVLKIVESQTKKRLSNPTIILDNNVKGETIKTTLVDTCDYLDREKPIISGNATFYMQPEVLESPTADMLRDMKVGRKEKKKEMYTYDPSDDEYSMLDLIQNNLKVIMNAEYGGSGNPKAAFYTKYSPAATTMMAQSIITTMAAFFEGFVGDNLKFFHINECVDWLNHACRKSKNLDIDNWIEIPKKNAVKSRMRRQFYLFNIEDNVVIDKYIDGCTDKQLVYIYYANNTKEFIKNHSEIIQSIHAVLSSLPCYEAVVDKVPNQFKSQFDKKYTIKENVKDYNDFVSREMFLDPYKIPDVVKNDMELLVDKIKQYCFIEYLTPDSIVKLNNHKRNTILLVDTDSNVIYANTFVQFVMEELFPDETFGRSSLYNDMICVNILATILDKCVEALLRFFGKTRNANEEAIKELVMKNEFLFRRFFLMNKKKRYATNVILREGNIMMPPKIDTKGLDFIKAGVTNDVTERFTKMLEEHILLPDEIQLHELMKDLRKFEKEIYDDLKSGGVRFLKPQSYKPEAAYKNPWGIQVFKAVSVWNAIYPDNKIYSLDKVKLIKLIVNSQSDLECIKNTYPNEYKIACDVIFNSPNKDLAKAGMKVIAIPSTVKQVPDWIVELIDYDLIIGDVCNSFRSVLDAFKIEELSVRTPSGKVSKTSSLVSI